MPSILVCITITNISPKWIMLFICNMQLTTGCFTMKLLSFCHLSTTTKLVQQRKLVIFLSYQCHHLCPCMLHHVTYLDLSVDVKNIFCRRSDETVLYYYMEYIMTDDWLGTWHAMLVKYKMVWFLLFYRYICYEIFLLMQTYSRHDLWT